MDTIEEIAALYRFKNLVRAAAAILAPSIILPNTNAPVVYAMRSLSVIGDDFKAVTVREYHFEDGKHEADVEVPELRWKESSFLRQNTCKKTE